MAKTPRVPTDPAAVAQTLAALDRAKDLTYATPAEVIGGIEQGIHLIRELDRDFQAVRDLEREAARHVESVVVRRTVFDAAKRRYQGWKGIGRVLGEALDRRDDLEERHARIQKILGDASLSDFQKTVAIQKALR